MQRRSFKENVPLDQRSREQAERLRKEAQGTLPGVMRHRHLGLCATSLFAKPGRRRQLRT
jgi:hypothetical protein